MRETTFEIVENVSNVVLAFRGHCVSVIYKDDFSDFREGASSVSSHHLSRRVKAL
jgi:hypothetical protein